MSVAIVRGDARRLPLPDATVDLIVTSVPYWGQRDYQDGGVSMPHQIGNEPTWQDWLAVMVTCVRRQAAGPVHYPRQPADPAEGHAMTTLAERMADFEPRRRGRVGLPAGLWEDLTGGVAQRFDVDQPRDPADGRWIKHANWHDSVDHSTGYKRSSIGQTADYMASVQERPKVTGDWRSGAKEYHWHVSRQRTQWEEEQPGYHPSMTHWERGELPSGVEPTMPKAKSAAMTAMKAHRKAHLEAGGDVGYPVSHRQRLAQRFDVNQPRARDGKWAKTGKGGLAGPWSLDASGEHVTYHGHMGIDRGDMPQLSGVGADGEYHRSAEMVPKFQEFLRKQGISVRERRVNPASLKPTQTTGDTRAIREIANELLSGELGDSKPITVSMDGRVLDGHHNWAGRLLANKEGGREGLNPNMRVVQVGLPMAELIKQARRFGEMHGIGQRKAGEFSNPAHARRGLSWDPVELELLPEVQRFNQFHAPAGSPAGGQFTTASGAGGQQGPAAQAKRKRQLLAEAKRDRAEAHRLQEQLAKLEHQHAQAHKSARHHRAQAAKAAKAAKANPTKAAKARAAAAKHHQARKTAAHKAAAHHRRQHAVHAQAATGYQAQIGKLRRRISALLGRARRLEAQAAAIHVRGPAARSEELARSGHWKHEWIPLDFAAAREKFHHRVPAGWQPGDVRHRKGGGAAATPQAGQSVAELRDARDKAKAKYDQAVNGVTWAHITAKGTEGPQAQEMLKAKRDWQAASARYDQAVAKKPGALNESGKPSRPVEIPGRRSHYGQPRHQRTGDLVDQANAAAEAGQYDKAARLLEQADALEAHEGVGAGSGSRAVIDYARQAHQRARMGERGNMAISHSMALAHSQRVAFHDKYGISPNIIDPATSPATDWTAMNKAKSALLAGNHQEADRLLAAEVARLKAARKTRIATRVDNQRARIAQAVASPKPGPHHPPLTVVSRTGDGTMQAIDHHDQRYTVARREGQIIVTGPGGTVSERATGDSETDTRIARELASRVAGQKAAPHEDEPAHEWRWGRGEWGLLEQQIAHQQVTA